MRLSILLFAALRGIPFSLQPGEAMSLKEAWDRNDVQFPRLLAEIRAVGLTASQTAQLCVSMDCTTEDICEILERAEEVFEGIKEHAPELLPVCYVCQRGPLV
jgi:hypothetical protein